MKNYRSKDYLVPIFTFKHHISETYYAKKALFIHFR